MTVADCLCECRQSAFFAFWRKNLQLFRLGSEEILPVFKAEMMYSKP